MLVTLAAAAIVGVVSGWVVVVAGEREGKVMEALAFTPPLVVELFSLLLGSSSLSPSRASGTGERLTNSLLGGYTCV